MLDDYYEHGTGLIAMLQNAQEVYGYLPRLAIQEISLQTGVSLSQIYGVSSFYNQFRLSPVGEYIIDVCHGTACHVAGAVQITEALEEELGVADGKTTTRHEVHPVVRRLHGRLLAGSRHAHRRPDLRRSHP